MNSYSSIMSFLSKNIFLAAGLIICFGVLLTFAACNTTPEAPKTDDVLLARVHQQSLYLSELKDMLPFGSNTEDSTLFVNAFVEQWVRERLLLHEAELNIPNDINIDALVRNYRSTLVLHNYEKKLIESDLDSTITQEEVQAFYEEKKDEYQLDSPIFRCFFAKIPLTAPSLEQVEIWWKDEEENDMSQLLNYCNKNAEVYFLNDAKWHEIDKIAKYLPTGVLTNASIRSQMEYVKQDDNYQYFLKILEIVTNKESLPLSYIENRAKKVILHQRKIKLIEQKKENLYDTALKSNTVQIFK